MPRTSLTRLHRLAAQLCESAEAEDDPYTVPVVVGVARVTKGPEQGFPNSDGDKTTTPVDICAEAVKMAAADSGAGDELLKRVKVMGWPVVNLNGETNDPCWLLQERMGGVLKLDARKGYFGGPGSSGQLYLNDFAVQVANGTLRGKAALVAMGEARHSMRRLRTHKKLNKFPNGKNAERGPPTLRAVTANSAAIYTIRQGEEEQQRQERLHGLTLPNYTYSLYENAIRAAAGRTIAEHRAYLGALGNAYSRESVKTPQYSWFTKEFKPEEITGTAGGNRMIAGPFYTRQMCAFNEVDMGAAAILTSAGVAAELGIPPSKWVYVHGVASTEDSDCLASRPSFAESVQHRIGFREALTMAGQFNGPGNVVAVDIYSPYFCMPSLAAKAMGVAVLPNPSEGGKSGRGWSITGGHCFHGAPGAGYGVIAIAAMTAKMREAGPKGGLGLVNTNGGIITSQGYGVYGAAPPKPGWMRRYRPPRDYNAEIDSVARPRFDPLPKGPCVIETYSVGFGHGSAAPLGQGGVDANLGVMVGRLGVAGDGARFVANTAGSYDGKARFASEPGPLKQLMEEDGWVGGQGTVTQDSNGRNIITLVAATGV